MSDYIDRQQFFQMCANNERVGRERRAACRCKLDRPVLWNCTNNYHRSVKFSTLTYCIPCAWFAFVKNTEGGIGYAAQIGDIQHVGDFFLSRVFNDRYPRWNSDWINRVNERTVSRLDVNGEKIEAFFRNFRFESPLATRCGECGESRLDGYHDRTGVFSGNRQFVFDAVWDTLHNFGIHHQYYDCVTSCLPEGLLGVLQKAEFTLDVYGGESPCHECAHKAAAKQMQLAEQRRQKLQEKLKSTSVSKSTLRFARLLAAAPQIANHTTHQ